MSEYNAVGYVQMIKDDARMKAYEAALRRLVKPGMRVLDLGAGLGVFALWALRLGAGKVYAVDPAPILSVADRLAKGNGLPARLVSIQNSSKAVDLPEPVDLVVSDLHGILPFFESHLPSIIDVRDRLLVQDGVMIPMADEVKVALVEDSGMRERHTVGHETEERLGLDLVQVDHSLANLWTKALLKRDSLLSAPALWAILDYHDVSSADMDSTVDLLVERDGTGHGFCAWFDSRLHPEVTMSNAPGTDVSLYGQGFFPWPQPVEMREGDRVEIRLRADLDKHEKEYIWSWWTTIRRGDKRERRFSQSTSLVYFTPKALREP